MPEQFEIVAQIRSGCLTLKKLAEKANLPMLAYLLDVAALEAVHHEMKAQRGLPPNRKKASMRRSKAVA